MEIIKGKQIAEMWSGKKKKQYIYINNNWYEIPLEIFNNTLIYNGDMIQIKIKNNKIIEYKKI